MPAAAARSKSSNSSGNSRQPPDPPLRDRVAAQLQCMAAEAQCAELAEGAADPEIAGDTVYRLMAHQLAAGHALTMSLGAHAGRLVREAKAGATADDDGGRRSQEMLRFVAGTARLMERCRSAALALDRIGFPELPEVDPEDDGPHNCKHRLHRPWVLQSERRRERRAVLDWLAQGKKAADLPEVEEWPEYHNPDPDIEKVDEWLAPDPANAQATLRRGRLKNNNPVGDYMTAPRCGARTRSGASCRQPAMPNGRCRFHGGKSTGPRTAEGLRRSRTARLTHGFRTAEIIDLRTAAARTGRNLRTLTRIARASLPSSNQKQKEITPLPLGERGQGVRGLARGCGPINNAHETGTPAAGDVPLLPRSYQTTRQLMPRLRAETPHPCPSPPRGEGCFSLPDAMRDDKRMRACIPAGHGVHRSDCTRVSSIAGRIPPRSKRNRG